MKSANLNAIKSPKIVNLILIVGKNSNFPVGNNILLDSII